MIAITPAIKALKIRNYGPIKKADLNFKKGINVIVGKQASGKSAVVNAIAHALCKYPPIYGNNKDSKKDFEIEVELYSTIIKAMPEKKTDYCKAILEKGILPNWQKRYRKGMAYEEIKQSMGTGDRDIMEIAEQLINCSKGNAIILDDEFSRMSLFQGQIAARLIKKSGVQAIITTTSMDYMPFKKCNIIGI